jgi:hypothetical protein
MDFLNNLFWLPINSIELIFNIGLWVLVGYVIFEAIQKYREQ